MSQLLLGSDGSFYGTTHWGGVGFIGDGFGLGTVFKVTSNGLLSVLVVFNGTNGSNPWGGLVQVGDGGFYGTTYGANGQYNPLGNVFRIETNGTLTNLVAFQGDDGRYPAAGVVRGTDGYLYGTTANGGPNSFGSVFKMTTNGVLLSLVAFNGVNGRQPQAALMQASDGNFYGTTGSGGTGDLGTVFKVTPSGILTTLISFNGSNGSHPYATLIQGIDGALYSTTAYGGRFSVGTVFRITTNGILTTLASFNGTNGSHPWAGLVRGSDGGLYGTTNDGAEGYDGTPSSGKGTVFRMTSNGILTTLVSFNGSNGMWPSAELIQANDGNFYGTTTHGGTNGYGTVFRLSVPLKPTIRTVMNTSNTISFNWNTVVGQTYQLQYTTNLTQTNWNNVSNAIAATNSTLSASDTISLDLRRFYRVVVLP